LADSPGGTPREKDSMRAAGGPYRRILAAYDGSENAKRALQKAVSLARAQSAALQIVVAVSLIMPVYGTAAPYYPPGYSEEVMKQGKKILGEALDRAKEAVPGATGVLKDGYASEVILAMAESDGVDLIVVGRRGMSRVERLLVGSVSSSVLSHSKCDVLVVK